MSAEVWRNDRDDPRDRFPARKSRSTRKSSRQVRSSDTRQAKAAEMSFDEQKTLTATKEDLEQNTTDTRAVMQ